MLPYRLRPPTFSDKAFKEKKQNESKNMLAGGGPVQRAMELDLMELRPKFLEQLNRTSQQHNSPGATFGAFRNVFGQAKVALVHTRTLPIRCDRDAYAQLLYASCLSLLKHAFQQDELMLEHAAFAIFCLYALYETNPLTNVPESPLQMLSMGVQCPENPKFLYRRTFRMPIRIDRYHFSLLQRVRDEALAQQADCQCARMQAWRANTADWLCTCGIAVDAARVVDRLMPCLDLGEYTGPRGLEALAGHGDYPYGCKRPKKTNAAPAENIARTNVIKLTDQELDRVMEAVPEPMNSLMEGIDRYRASLQAIRLPPAGSNQVARIRGALNPIFAESSEPSWQEVSAVISTGENTGKTHNISDQGPEMNVSARANRLSSQNEGSRVTHFVNEESVPQDTRGETVVDDGISFKLMLPSDISQAMQDGIQAAVDAVIASSETLIEPATAAREASLAESRDANEMGTTEEGRQYSIIKDGCSVVDGGVSVFSNATGHAEAALRALFKAASAESPTFNKHPVSVVQQERGASDKVNRRFGNAFLTMNSHLIQDNVPLEPDHSDISSVSSDESIGSTAVGRMALRALLLEVDGGGTKHRSENGERKRKASTNKMGSRQSKKTVRRKRSGDSDDLSLPSIREPGKAALDVLLSQVALDQEDDDEVVFKHKVSPDKIRSRKLMKAASRKQSEDGDDLSLPSIRETGRAALYALFSQAVLDLGDDDEDKVAFKF